MKKIEAVIKPFKLDEVKEALHEVGLQVHHGARGQRLRPPERPTPNCIAAPNTWSTFCPR